MYFCLDERICLNMIRSLTFFHFSFVSWSEYDDGSGNACGHDGAQDNNSWYMGLSPCYRANAAYSLYGILKGEEDTGCNRKTFINSFFTTTGVESFTEAMVTAGNVFSSSGDDDNYAGGVSANSCEAVDEEGQQDNGNNNYNWGHNWRFNQGYNSKGIGCSNGEYVTMSFPGAHCTKNAAAKVTDELNTFNAEMSTIECQPIFQNGKSVGGQNNDGNGDGDGGGDNNANNANGADDGAMDLLSNSESCNVLEYPKACPDPFGKLVKYNRRLEDSTGFVHNKRKEKVRKILSWFMFVVGSLMIVTAIIAWRDERRAQREREQQQKSYQASRRAARQAAEREQQAAMEQEYQENERRRERSRSRSRDSRKSSSNDSNKKSNRFQRWFRRNKN